VRALDNVIDRTRFPLPAQRDEAQNKRRIGVGVTGLANCLEAMGMPYGSRDFLQAEDDLLDDIKHQCYWASVQLAMEKGAFPLFDKEKYCAGEFIKTLDGELQEAIYEEGIRNSHLTSIAPTGTISLTADNVSSGIEPVFQYGFDRTVIMPEGTRIERVEDYGARQLHSYGILAENVTAEQHVDVLLVAAKHVDSSVSKTCNVSGDMAWDDFKDIYRRAWEGGAKGCTVYNKDGKRAGVLNSEPEEKPEACTYDWETGKRTCE
jgi:ribonucleoside-diphosphate reductase alpha chain